MLVVLLIIGEDFGGCDLLQVNLTFWTHPVPGYTTIVDEFNPSSLLLRLHLQAPRQYKLPHTMHWSRIMIIEALTSLKLRCTSRFMQWGMLCMIVYLTENIFDHQIPSHLAISILARLWIRQSREWSNFGLLEHIQHSGGKWTNPNWKCGKRWQKRQELQPYGLPFVAGFGGWVGGGKCLGLADGGVNDSPLPESCPLAELLVLRVFFVRSWNSWKMSKC